MLMKVSIASRLTVAIAVCFGEVCASGVVRERMNKNEKGEGERDAFEGLVVFFFFFFFSFSFSGSSFIYSGL